MEITLKLGEKITLKGRSVTVTQYAFDNLPKIRQYLIEVAERGETATYGELIDDLDLPWQAQGLGRVLDLLSKDCITREEPSLAAIAVNAGTGEVGEDFAGDPETERRLVYAHWSTSRK